MHQQQPFTKRSALLQFQVPFLYSSGRCPMILDYSLIGESGRRIAERIKDHNRRNHKSHMLKHSLETGHERVKSFDFSIISKNFNGNQRK